MIDHHFWKNKKVLLTGHTGFKGAWLLSMLNLLGAKVTGLSLPSEDGSLFDLLGLKKTCRHLEIDICDKQKLLEAMIEDEPDIVLHLAAQSLVRKSYEEPLETFETNVNGSLHLLEALRHCTKTKAVVMVTSDKCYRNNEWVWGYREHDAFGGEDPYSASKGAMEIAVHAWRQSFFKDGPFIATARAGNVIGGGDWAEDRLVPDLVRAWSSGHSALIRNPNAVRPWQHVLDPLIGYMVLAQRLCEGGAKYDQGWNFGPPVTGCWNVGRIADYMKALWSDQAAWHTEAQQDAPHEARLLALDSSKAHMQLGWQPTFTIEQALKLTADWYHAWFTEQDLSRLTQQQIKGTLNIA